MGLYKYYLPLRLLPLLPLVGLPLPPLVGLGSPFLPLTGVPPQLPLVALAMLSPYISWISSHTLIDLPDVDVPTSGKGTCVENPDIVSLLYALYMKLTTRPTVGSPAPLSVVVHA